MDAPVQEAHLVALTICLHALITCSYAKSSSSSTHCKTQEPGIDPQQ